MSSSRYQCEYPRAEVQWYYDELAARVVATSGVPSDRHHVGKLLLQVFQENPDVVALIDGDSERSYTNRQLLEQTVRCATAFRKLGVRVQDVVMLLAPKSVDLSIPYYACLYIGAIAAAIERERDDLPTIVATAKPKIIFCQCDQTDQIRKILDDGQLVARIITLDRGERNTHFEQFLVAYGGQEPIEEFEATDFDPEETIAYLNSTSGSTAKSKLVPISHKSASMGAFSFWLNCVTFPSPTRLLLSFGALHMGSSNILYIGAPILQVSILQLPETCSQERFYYLLNTYKPTATVLFVGFLLAMLRPSNRDPRALSCIEFLSIVGSMVSKELVQKIKETMPKSTIVNGYGASEMASFAFFQVETPIESVGRPLPDFQYRLVDPETQAVIDEPNRIGELWLKSPSIFKGYYKQPEESDKYFSEDGWYKTGDILYRDQHWNFFFYERAKFLIKHKNKPVSPSFIENAIYLHPGVHQVSVTDVTRPDAGAVLAAFVVRRPGCDVTAREVKELVQKNFFQYGPETEQDSNDTGIPEQLGACEQLRGVVFLRSLPLLASGKVDRLALRTMADDLELV